VSRFGVLVAASFILTGCAVLRPVTAGSADQEDYQTIRLVSNEGERLVAAQRYLAKHPNGAWAADVRAEYERAEAAFFQHATESRDGSIGYLAILPSGPHADAALASVRAFDGHIADDEIAHLVAAARQSTAALDAAAKDRREAADFILQSSVVLLTGGTVGRAIAENEPLRVLLEGSRIGTWGGTPRRRVAAWSYLVPTRTGPEPREISVTVEVEEDDGRVVRAFLRGPALFSRWLEADTARAVDDTHPDDRAAAAEHAREIVSGVVEAQLPAATCGAPAEGDLFRRTCKGVSIRVHQGAAAGDTDTVTIFRL